jgi:uncharacterized membrane protein YphA (DoxX/SURF4 family)
MNVRTWSATAFRVALAAVWLYAGASKVSDADASGRAVRAYQLLPDGMARAVGFGLPFVEITIGLLLLAGIGVRVLAGVSIVLLGVFVGAIISAWARGLTIDCGCFGGGGTVAADRTRYGQEIGRDLLFVAMAGFLLYWPWTRLALDNLLFKETSE